MEAASLIYTPIIGGPRSGFLTLELNLGPGRSVAPLGLAREIEQAAAGLRMPHRLLSITAGQYSDRDEEDITKLIRALREMQFSISATIPGGYFPDWLEYVPYRVMTLGAGETQGIFRANEIHFDPGETWEEPRLSRMDAARYVLVPKGAPIDRILSFLKEARNEWGLIQQPKSLYVLSFFTGGGR